MLCRPNSIPALLLPFPALLLTHLLPMIFEDTAALECSVDSVACRLSFGIPLPSKGNTRFSRGVLMFRFLVHPSAVISTFSSISVSPSPMRNAILSCRYPGIYFSAEGFNARPLGQRASQLLFVVLFVLATHLVALCSPHRLLPVSAIPAFEEREPPWRIPGFPIPTPGNRGSYPPNGFNLNSDCHTTQNGY